MRVFRIVWLAAALLWLAAGSARADIRPLGPNLFVAGVPSGAFEFYAAPEQDGRQRQANWCWAACIQMTLNYHGLYVTQEQIVARVFGGLVDAPAGPHEILAALSGWAPDRRGSFSAVYADPYVWHGAQIIQDLAYRWPLIVGLARPGAIGHAYVLTAVVYSVGPYGEPILHRVVLRDPWPGSPSRVEMSWQEFQARVQFAARVYVRRL
ncbi:MAG: hypothetical protein NZ585_13950 [Chloracidobacterium sp.]|nr:hypothetical protein [Chloracidobacterium sp.]